MNSRNYYDDDDIRKNSELSLTSFALTVRVQIKSRHPAVAYASAKIPASPGLQIPAIRYRKLTSEHIQIKNT